VAKKLAKTVLDAALPSGEFFDCYSYKFAATAGVAFFVGLHNDVNQFADFGFDYLPEGTDAPPVHAK